MAKEIAEWSKALIVACVITFGFMHFFTALQVFDVSMNPTLVENDRLLLWNTHNVEKGDIVIYETNIPLTDVEQDHMGFLQKLRNGKYKTLIKRVVAVGGDSIDIADGKVVVNGEELKERYTLEDYTMGDVHIDKIPEGKVFTMGDNRQNSHDSRSEDIGPVDAQKIKGKVLFRFWPLNKLGSIAK